MRKQLTILDKTRRYIADETDSYATELVAGINRIIASLEAVDDRPIGEIDEGDDGAFVELYPDRSFKLGQKVYTHPLPSQQESAQPARVPEGFFGLLRSVILGLDSCVNEKETAESRHNIGLCAQALVQMIPDIDAALSTAPEPESGWDDTKFLCPK